MNKIYVITGQTATGKTAFAHELATKTNGELINCDSRQIYKYLDIITGKDVDKTSKEFQLKKTIHDFEIGTYTFTDGAIPIWLYDIVTPDKPFSTFDYRTCALEVITDIIKRKKTPIIIGGTYFYLKHLLYGTVQTFVEPNKQLRTKLNNKTLEELQNILKGLDSALFNQLNNSEKHNPHRLIRKIEILQSNSSKQKKQPALSELLRGFEIEIIGFQFASKEQLINTISDRVEERLKNGAIDEVNNLLNNYSVYDPGLQTIGYKQIISYVNNNITFDEMTYGWITKEVQYAKRQMTFMKKDEHITWKTIDTK